MRLRAALLDLPTLKRVLVFRQLGAHDPSLSHAFPYCLGFAVFRRFGHLFAVGCVFTKFRWGVHADLRLKPLNSEIAGLVPQSAKPAAADIRAAEWVNLVDSSTR